VRHGVRPALVHTGVCRSLPRAGMKKMVINHIEKLFVTSDSATILRCASAGRGAKFALR
jgi:hypothetical protein